MGKLIKFAIGFLVGAFTGSLTALLLAPKTGFELRREIQTDVDKWIKEAESTVTGSYILLETPKTTKG
jgi:gas vesicle protein